MRFGKFTAMASRKPKAIDQRCAWRAASLSAHSLIATIKPDSSATGMKSPGGTNTSPRCQRISASTPTMRPEPMSILGW